jgi:hypothetical protein
LEGEGHQQRDDGAAGGGGRRHAGEETRFPGRLIGLLELGVEACQAQRAAGREQQRKRPADRLHLVERPEIDQNRGRHPEAQKVGQRIELGAELGGDLEETRRAAVQTVEDPGQDDQYDRQLVAVVEGVADRGQPGAQAQHGEDVGHQVNQGLRAKAPAAAALRKHQLRLQPLGG